MWKGRFRACFWLLVIFNIVIIAAASISGASIAGVVGKIPRIRELGVAAGVVSSWAAFPVPGIVSAATTGGRDFSKVKARSIVSCSNTNVSRFCPASRRFRLVAFIAIIVLSGLVVQSAPCSHSKPSDPSLMVVNKKMWYIY